MKQTEGICCFQEEQAGVVPKCRNFYPRSQSNERDRYYRNYVRSNGHSTRGNSLNGRQESQGSEESESGKIIRTQTYQHYSNID